MESKAPLVLIEQLIMIMVFALVSTFCIQIFVKADEISRRSRARDQVVVAVQNEAERLVVRGTSKIGEPGLKYFTLSGTDIDGTILFQVEVARQVE